MAFSPIQRLHGRENHELMQVKLIFPDFAWALNASRTHAPQRSSWLGCIEPSEEPRIFS
jgi:hypothetical protein